MAGIVDADEKGATTVGQYSPRNRKKLTEYELEALPPLQRSRYLAYEDPPKQIAEHQMATRKRVFEKMRQEKQWKQSFPVEEEEEKQQHEKLIGQLKAAEARNRIRITRLRYESSRADEVSQLVASQPSAVTAVRLQALLPLKKDSYSANDPLNKLSRDRVERLMNDDLGITIGRT